MLNKTIYTIFGLIIVSIILILFIFGFWKYIPNINHIRDIRIQGTMQNRLYTWDTGIQSFIAKPLLGWGNENIIIAHDKYFNPKTFNIGGVYETNKDRYHNIYLDILVQYGVFGLLLWLAILIYLLWQFWKKGQYLWIGLLVATSASVFFSFYDLSSYLMLFIFISLYDKNK